MSQSDGNGTRQERLERSLERARRKKVAKSVAELEAELLIPPFPTALGYIWHAYIRLRRRTAMGFNGPQPITFADIDAFVRHGGLRLAPWEIAILEQIDDIYLRDEAKPTAPEGGPVKALAAPDDAKGVRSILGNIGVRRKVKRKKK